jgi:hypothetical protein
MASVPQRRLELLELPRPAGSVKAVCDLHDTDDGDGELAMLREVIRCRAGHRRVTVLQDLGEDVGIQ